MNRANSLTGHNLARVLGPVHIWGLGVGIVLVGEYMGWNLSIGRGGPYGALLACFVAGLLYTCVSVIDAEVTSTLASAGGQYTQAKHIVGPLMAFNVALFGDLSFTMLAAANAQVVGILAVDLSANLGLGHLQAWPFVLLTIVGVVFLNYHRVRIALGVTLAMTAIAAIAILALFVGTRGWADDGLLQHAAFMPPAPETLPFGVMGAIAAFPFGLWFYLGIEGTCQAAEEVRSPGRALPLGTLTGMMTLIILALITWYICTGLLPWRFLASSSTPLLDAATVSGIPYMRSLLLVATFLACIASTIGCVNDASRTWFALGRDHYMPAWLGVVHTKHRSPFAATLFVLPMIAAFAFLAPLDQVIVFSILGGVLTYTFMAINMILFRQRWPLSGDGAIRRGFVHPFHPWTSLLLLLLCTATFFAIYIAYGPQLLFMLAYYVVASWFFVRLRYPHVVQQGLANQFRMNWPKPS